MSLDELQIDDEILELEPVSDGVSNPQQVDSEEIITSDNELDDFLESLISTNKNKSLEAEKNVLESVNETAQDIVIPTKLNPNQEELQPASKNQKKSLLQKMRSSLGVKNVQGKNNKDSVIKKTNRIKISNNKQKQESLNLTKASEKNLAKLEEEQKLDNKKLARKAAKKKLIQVRIEKDRLQQERIREKKKRKEKPCIKTNGQNDTDQKSLARKNFEKLDSQMCSKEENVDELEKLKKERAKIERELRLKKELEKINMALKKLSLKKQRIAKELQKNISD